MLINPIIPETNSTPAPVERKSSSQEKQDTLSGSSSEKETSLSSLAQIAVSRDITDLTINSEKTSFAYYSEDHSLAMKAYSQTNISLHEEVYNFDITFSADALGLKSEDFKDDQPMVLKFSYSQQETNYTYNASVQKVKTLRQPQEILSDLAKGLREVLKNRGNKTVIYELDEEARQALMGDPKMLALMGELVLLMASINLAKKEGDCTNYKISVSGKGKPYLNVEEKTNLESKSRTINYSITINPPAQNSAAGVSMPQVVSAESTSGNVNVAV